MQSFFQELKRRNVFRVGAAYLVASWLVVQLVETIFPAFGFGDGAVRIAVLMMGIGAIPVLIMAWAFEITPEGVKRENEVDRSQSITTQTGRKLNRAFIILLIVSLGFFAADKFVLAPERVKAELAQARQEGAMQATDATQIHNVGQTPATNPVKSQSVAVLPFVAMSRGEDDEYFADGLTEEILNALAQLPELLVTARTSAFFFKGKDVPVQEIAQTLGVKHIVEGSVRRDRGKLRVTAQLIRAADGFHLWSETFDRSSEDSFGVQTDVAEKIALALNVVLDDKKRAQMREAGVADPEAFIAFQKGVELADQAHENGDFAEGLARANTYFEQAIKLAPNFSDAYTWHADYYTHLLMQAAIGQRFPNVTEADIAAAPAALKKDLDNALRTAADEGRRRNLEFDRALVLGQWRGLLAMADRALFEPGCTTAQWLDFVSAFGRGRQLLDDLGRELECDPLVASDWRHQVEAAIWMDEPELAVELGLRGIAMVSSDALVASTIEAMVAAGRLDDAQALTDQQLRAEERVVTTTIFLAAVRGDQDLGRSLLVDHKAQLSASTGTELSTYAWMGDRETANLLASQVDARPLGYIVLLQALDACFCGAPFDLTATPNFAVKLEEAGMQWPPPSPINFPLKTW
jgi:TolB-like protein